MKRIAIIGLKVVLVLVVGISTFMIANALGLSMNCNHRDKNVSWDTGYVSLQADEFRIIADGKNYYANVYEVDISGSKGSTRRDLGLEWDESGVEMRLYIVFWANESYWWSDEIRTYNGQEDGDWIYYTGMFFETSIGNTFTGNVDLQSDENNAYEGEIHIKNLTLQAFGLEDEIEEEDKEAARTECDSVQLAVDTTMAEVEEGIILGGDISSAGNNVWINGSTLLDVPIYIDGGIESLTYTYSVATDGRVTATSGPLWEIAGKYINQDNANVYLELKENGTYYRKAAAGELEIIDAKWRVVKVNEIARIWFEGWPSGVVIDIAIGTIEGNKLIDPDGIVWIKE